MELLVVNGIVLHPILDYPNYYVSRCGKVYSNRRRNTFLKSCDRPYCKLTLKNEQGCRGKFVHRLVAETFIPNPRNLPEVNHING